MIRQATVKDAEAIAAIYNYYIVNTIATFEESEITANEINTRIMKVGDAGLPWLVLEEDCQIVGYAYAATWNTRSAYRHTAEVTIYLLPQMASKGLGYRLYQELFSQLRKKDIHTVIGVIALPNLVSVAIHEKFAMKKVGHFEQLGYKFGKWHDVGYWQAKLNA